MPLSFRPAAAPPQPLSPAVPALAALKLAIPFFIPAAWGFHRDSLLYLAMGDHLDLFRMQFPPFIALMARLLDALGGTTVLSARLLPSLAGAAYVLVAGLIARDLGGGRRAQLLAALATLAAPVFLRSGILFQPVVFEQLWWLVACWALLRLLRDDGRGWWLVLGGALGLAALTKFSAAFLAAGVVAAVLVSARRGDVREPWPWLAVGLAVLVGLPSLTGQVAWGWPFLEQARVLRATQLERVSPLDFVGGQLLLLGAAAPVAVLGLAVLLAGRVLDGRRVREPWRALGLLVLVTGALFLVSGGKAYYLAPLHGMLLAAGAVRIERWAAASVAPRFALVASFVIVGGLVLLPLGAPVLSPAPMAGYARALGATKATETNTGGHLDLPQDYADMLGWEEQVIAVAEVYRALPPWEQSRVVILATNYGRAGALQHYGARHGLPAPVSPAGDFHAWGPGDRPGDVMLVVGGDRAELERFFRSVTVARVVTNPMGVDEEREVPIYVAREPVTPLRELWPRIGPAWG